MRFKAATQLPREMETENTEVEDGHTTMDALVSPEDHINVGVPSQPPLEELAVNRTHCPKMISLEFDDKVPTTAEKVELVELVVDGLDKLVVLVTMGVVESPSELLLVEVVGAAVGPVLVVVDGWAVVVVDSSVVLDVVDDEM